MNHLADKVWVKKTLWACKEMLRVYEEKNPTGSCPLCVATGDEGCSECAWEIFEGMSCCDFVEERRLKKPVSYYAYLMPKFWLKIRIPMLRRWIKDLEGMLKE